MSFIFSIKSTNYCQHSCETASLLAGHKHVRCLIGRLHLNCSLTANDRRYLQHIVFGVQHRHRHGIFTAIAWILIGLLHQVDQLGIEIGPSGRLIHDQVPYSLDAGAPEEMGTLRVEHKVSAAMKEHIARSSHFSVLFWKHLGFIYVFVSTRRCSIK